ncbi:molybdopterin dinucleotide binding domain-containing protein [Oceanicoccus sagamiensis]|uniref:molybdopterin dinucleotide binding domain-containing protein n=1 Tax=Oceanicoccus sagamiensis TaxID=716816 RepID=UPI001F0A9AE8|nr:molybdopterin dinucleotide binding domain-containing protein [Oceanicoccus sagamiensis]
MCNVSGFFPTDSDVLSCDDLYSGEDNEINILDLPDLVLAGDSPPEGAPVKSLFIYNHNPVAVHPRQGTMQAALQREDVFIVGSDITMTDSMQYADIILPAASHLEYSDLYQSYGHAYLQQSEPAIDPVGEALPNTDIFRRLAARFNFTDKVFQASDQELIDQALDFDHPALQGRERSALSPVSAVDCLLDHNGQPTPTLLRGESADTPSGKIELFCAALEQECGEGLPQWKPQQKEYPFILVSPSSEKRTNSTFGHIEGHDSDVVLEMHARDAKALQLSDGQTVQVYNQQASVTLALKVSDRIKPGTLYTPKGAWLKSARHTINALIPGHKADLAGGACYNDTQVNVKAASELPNRL